MEKNRIGVAVRPSSLTPEEQLVIRAEIEEYIRQCDVLNEVIKDNTRPYANPAEDVRAGKAYRERSRIYREIATRRVLLGIDPECPFPYRCKS